jgi:hypothetical protein
LPENHFTSATLLSSGRTLPYPPASSIAFQVLYRAVFALRTCIWRRFFASHAPAVVLVDNSTMKEQEQQQQDEAAVSS